MYLIEVDRVLRPGGHWKKYYQSWQRSIEEFQKEQEKIEEMAELLCWEKEDDMSFSVAILDGEVRWKWCIYCWSVEICKAEIKD
jgi:hypothetical protein